MRIYYLIGAEEQRDLQDHIQAYGKYLLLT